jgi:hypothetical protein
MAKKLRTIAHVPAHLFNVASTISLVHGNESMMSAD